MLKKKPRARLVISDVFCNNNRRLLSFVDLDCDPGTANLFQIELTTRVEIH